MAGVCKLCGTPHADGAKFCTECGAVLISRVGENSTGVTVTNAVVNETVAPKTNVENVENTENTENSVTTDTAKNENTPDAGVSNTYGAVNSENPSAFTNPYGGGNYNAPNGSNPYGGGNYNAPNGSGPYGGGNYNAPNGSNPYGGGNYNAPNGSNPYGGGNYNAPNGSSPYGGANYNAPNGSGPYGGGNYNAPNGSSPYGGANYNAPNGSNPYGVNNQMQPVRPMNIGLLIFSIINLLLGCCSCTGFIFGGAGLAFTIMAKNAKTDGDAANNSKIAMILNIIGVVLTVLIFVASIAIGMTEGFSTEY